MFWCVTGGCITLWLLAGLHPFRATCLEWLRRPERMRPAQPVPSPLGCHAELDFACSWLGIGSSNILSVFFFFFNVIPLAVKCKFWFYAVETDLTPLNMKGCSGERGKPTTPKWTGIFSIHYNLFLMKLTLLEYKKTCIFWAPSELASITCTLEKSELG